MHINSNTTLTATDVHCAVSIARNYYGQDVILDGEVTTSPRGRLTFYCASVNGTHKVFRDSDSRAASWTAWGYVIAALYMRDPNAVIGQYRNRDHFIRTIYGEQRRYIIRQSLGCKNYNGVGADCGFLSVFDSELLSDRYNEMR